MKISKTAKLAAHILYALGVFFVLILLGFVLFGAHFVPFPDAMLPSSLREIAFFWLAAGALPMLAACAAVYKCNGMKTGPHKKRNFILLFAPAFLCGACLLVLLGIFAVMMVQGMALVSRRGG